YWSRDPRLWGNVHDWDLYWIKEQKDSRRITKHNSHTALSDELRDLEKIFTDSSQTAYEAINKLRKDLKETPCVRGYGNVEWLSRAFRRGSPALAKPMGRVSAGEGRASVASYQGNMKLWETSNLIASLNQESKLVDMQLEVDKKKGFRSGLQIARKGFQLYSDIEFDTVERERKRTRTGSPLSEGSDHTEGNESVIKPPVFKLKECRSDEAESKTDSRRKSLSSLRSVKDH
ncbi:8817_t:CDS:2, partial [Paraglomus occultum]